MYAKVVCFVLVLLMCECNGSRIVYRASGATAGNTSDSIPLGPFTNLPSSDQSEIANFANSLQANIPSGLKPNIPDNIRSTVPEGQNPNPNNDRYSKLSGS
ncbi:uncharacterized protein LOC123876544 [Maniola jurtina]|uniref:uncharacterized protein LOC123876544 n=1 Tax=Maniola jurtina TaxID=191418 RepID=UPI001E687AAE|nr:uncharacterized protein LOC123876544 [Maniola jurtina]